MKIEGEQDKGRRNFLGTGFKVLVVTSLSGLSLFGACKQEDESEDKEVSPPEDLMQEHGLLNRILLIYDCCRTQLSGKGGFQKEMLLSSAQIIRTFVEDYHEKQEENYLFPRFERANKLVELVKVLKQQHDAGRRITAQIIQVCKSPALTHNDDQTLIRLLTDFNTMYRPHEAREDTILFPAFRKIVSRHEYDSLGEEFENNEHKRFGEDGFDTMVNKVAEIEKKLDIYDLSQFSPKG